MKRRPSPSLRRIRAILPSDGNLVTFFSLFFICEVPIRIMIWWFNAPAQSLPHPAKYLLMFTSLNYGASRVFGFHPYYQGDYRNWLARSPWKRGMPLTAGPVFPVPEDVLGLAALALLALTQPDLDPLGVIARVLIGYCLALAATFWKTGVTEFAYLTLFGVGLAVRLWPDPRACLAAIALTVPVALMGLWRSFGLFPWDGFRLPKFQPDGEISNRPEAKVNCGWPYESLSPKLPAPKPWPLTDKLLLSLLFGWGAFAICGPLGEGEERSVVMGMALSCTGFALVVGRYFLYRQGIAPPINVWGRLSTLRLIVPGYDRIYLGPFFSLSTIVFASIEFHRMGLPEDIWIPITITLAFFVNFVTGPNLLRWRLTGKLRILPTQKAGNTEFVRTS